MASHMFQVMRQRSGEVHGDASSVLCYRSDTAYTTCLSLLQIGESSWAPPLPLESSDSSSQADDMNTKPVLLRAQIPEWGAVHELVARVEMAGTGFERTMVSFCALKLLPKFPTTLVADMQLSVDFSRQTCLLCVLRLGPHCFISNRTGIPLQIMHFNTGNKVQRLGGKATGVQPSRGQQPQRAPPGLKGVVANPQQDWTSCIDVPTGMLCNQPDCTPECQCC